MTPKQQRFVEEYLIDLNATQAAIRAGYSPNGAEVTGSQLLRNPKVAVALAESQAKRAERVQVTADRVLAEYARLAFTDLRDAASWSEDGMRIVPSDKLTDSAAAAIKEVRIVKTITRGKDNYEQERIEQRIQMHDKKGALDSLAKHLGMFSDGTTIYNDNRTLEVMAMLTLEELRQIARGDA